MAGREVAGVGRAQWSVVLGPHGVHVSERCASKRAAGGCRAGAVTRVREGGSELLSVGRNSLFSWHGAAFTSTANDRDAYLDKHRRLLADDRLVRVVAELDGEVVGSAAAFPSGEDTDVTYWIRRDHWGRDLAGAAPAAVLEQVPVRPVFASAAHDNTERPIWAGRRIQ